MQGLKPEDEELSRKYMSLFEEVEQPQVEIALQSQSFELKAAKNKETSQSWYLFEMTFNLPVTVLVE
jgi:hypothetical protein